MKAFANILKSMDFEFFANGKHKITAERLFESKDAVFLDVRSKEEIESIAFPLRFQAECIHIAIDEVPDRLLEIPKDKPIGIFFFFCTRSAIVYAFLRANGYNNVKIIVGGYVEMIDVLKPGKIRRHVK